MARELGDLAQARDLFRESLEVAGTLGDLSGVARAYNGLVVAWPELAKLAARSASDGSNVPLQDALI